MPGRQKTAFMSSTLIFLLFIPLIQSEDLMDITTSVFGNFSGVIPAAFGDFNGDKLTDMFVLSVELEPPHEVVKVTVLLAQEQKDFELIISDDSGGELVRPVVETFRDPIFC